MTFAELNALWPFILLAATPVAVMLAIAARRHHQFTVGLTLLGLGGAFASLFVAAPLQPQLVTPLLIVDHFTLFYLGLLIAASAIVTVLAYGYLEGGDQQREEFYVLLLLATLGAAVLTASRHFVSFFLGLELLSVSLYALIAYPLQNRRNIEAGLKYLVLAAASSAFLLFGMALIYAASGTLDFTRIVAAQTAPNTLDSWTLVGAGMIITGIGFKLAVVPFHLWAPDIYEGAPAPVSAFVATVSKGSVFALLLRLSTYIDLRSIHPFFTLLAAIAIISMFTGNLLALLQNNVKRLLAYSSISHLGYLLVALLASGSLAATAATFYLAAYFVANLGAFGVVTILSNSRHEAEWLEDYAGLFWRKPWLAGVLTAMLLSLAGIPLTAGFVGKFYLVAAGSAAALWGLILVLVASSLIGLFYYLRVVAAMYQRPADTSPSAARPAPALAGSLILAGLVLLLVWLGVYPDPLIQMIQAALASLS